MAQLPRKESKLTLNSTARQLATRLHEIQIPILHLTFPTGKTNSSKFYQIDSQGAKATIVAQFLDEFE